MPFMIQKSDGGFNYDTTDLAALKYRVEVDKAERIIIVTDMGQSLHFQLLFKAAAKAGYVDPNQVELDHVGFGLVLAESGKKFKTRSGDTEKLIDLLHTAIAHAAKVIAERNPDWPQEKQALLARKLGIAAVKYADLSSQRQKDYTFSYARMLCFEGNTAVFLLYSYVRMLGIQRKVGRDVAKLDVSFLKLEHSSEIVLALHLLRFAEVLQLVAKELLPHLLCDYLYKLAEKFNAFFRDCKVQGSTEEVSRSILVEVTRSTLEKGLYILGITTVDQM